MRTELQIQASRLNGQKSRGPISRDGKRNSSLNRIDHGLLAAEFIIDGESPERFAAHSEALHAELNPQTKVQTDLVEMMVLCQWRMKRAWVLENAKLAYEIRKQALSNGSETKRTRAALAFTAPERRLARAR
jgi:hypothetical protein